MDLREAERRLYGEDPDAFVATRSSLVSAARTAGDRELATRIGKLAKPTRSAWLVNLLAAERPELITQLLDLAELLGEAHRTVSGEELRTLSRQRNTLVRAIAATAIGLGRDHGYQAPESAQQQVVSSLDAALADPSVADLVRSGTLVKPASFSGFGPAAVGAPTDAASARRSDPELAPVIELDSRRRGQQRRQAEAAAGQARRELDRAEAAMERSRERIAGHDEEVATHSDEVRAANDRRREAEATVARLAADLAAAERVRDGAVDELGHAEAARDQAAERRDRSRAELERAQQQRTTAERSLADAETLLDRLGPADD